MSNEDSKVILECPNCKELNFNLSLSITIPLSIILYITPFTHAQTCM